MASVNGSSAEANTTHQILEWYSKLFSRRVDLIGDFAGSERFLIHGESLLLQCFSDPHIDFDPGFQILHASYAVEKFLQGLSSRCCNFHIAFFDEHQHFCVPQDVAPELKEKYLLARTAIIRHLSVNLPTIDPNIEIKTFSSTTSSAFYEYMRSTDIYFILSNDGASSKDVQKRVILQKELDNLRDEDRELNERHELYKTFYRKLIFNFREQGLSVALINGLEWLDTKVVTTVLEHSRPVDLNISQLQLPLVDEDLSDDDDSLDLQKAFDQIRSSSDESLSESEYLSVMVASKLASSHNNHLITSLLFHTALLSELRLSDRMLENASPTLPEYADFILEFCQEARKILSSDGWKKQFDSKTKCDVADLIDGRLLNFCMSKLTSKPPKLFRTLVELVNLLSGEDVLDTSKQTQNSSSGSATTKELVQQQGSYSVLPFTNETFDRHLAPIKLNVSQRGAKADQTSATIFREVSHWHNKRSTNQKSNFIEKDPKIAKKVLRRNQFFMAEMTSYAASLTNAVGKVLDPETIIPGEKTKAVSANPLSSAQNTDDERQKKAQKKGNKNKNAAKQAMMANIEADSKRKDEDDAGKQYHAWGSVCDGLEKKQELAARYEGARQYLLKMSSDSKRKTLEPEVRVYLLNILLRIWKKFCQNGTKEKGLYIAALVFDTVKAICGQATVTKTVAGLINTTIEQLKLPKLPVPKIQGDRKLPFTFTLDQIPSFDISVNSPKLDFQLLHCGPYFDRLFDSAPDARVPFQPDAWQRKVLDEIDARRSLLVIAPTSAGKTFISFYAMKQVLKSGNDDVLVYVAPTKALVNQIAAEVQARFSKNYKYSQSVWGIHTRDYRINNPTGCQVLVTVPHILQIMLLAPSHANSWSKRVKWIIFDEVHCIGQAEDGLIWEQLLLMAPCPIIALSATIGNASVFNDWLVSTQRAVDNELVMVQHPHRYSDLRKFVYKQPAKQDAGSYLPLPSKRALAQLGLDEHEDFVFLHPIACLTNRKRGLPSDLALEARDCLTLYNSMEKHQTKAFPVDKSLDPSAILPPILKKADIIKWESALKKALSDWMANEDSPFKEVRKDLSESLTCLSSQQNDDGASLEYEEAANDANQDISSILPLLAALQEQDALPAIIFNYDRAVCERMCQDLLKQFQAAETEWKDTSPKWKEKLKAWTAWKKNKARPPKTSSRGDAVEGMTKADQAREEGSVEESSFASFDPEKALDGFHFADNSKLSQNEIEVYAKELRYRGVEEWLIDGLKRGIGVHHAGMNRKYRYCVEMFFRKGFLRVVIATGTLALGINMPCKTVVFSGDSVFLTALNFRQASGRAGRRGFDMLGNVVFHRIRLNKIHKLVSSRLPDLNGHFPLTTTLVLRLFTLLHSSENSQFAKHCIDALLAQPRLYLGGEDAKMTVLHHLRFSIEYLRRQHLLDSQGVPLNFAGIVSHLYFTENSSFAFHALLKDGYFHKLCANIDGNPETVKKELMLTMAHLFGRRYCRQADEEFVEEVVKKSSSIVFLPSMPESAATILRQHNETTLDIFTAYVCTFVDQHLTSTDNTLPLTQVKIGSSSPPASKPDSNPAPKARSLFVALSGYNDTFSSIHDLCNTTRSGVFLEEAVIPHVGIYPDASSLPLNAYLYDFFNAGDINALVTANRIRRGDVWFVLNDFSMVLATIVTSLSNFVGLAAESELDIMDVKGGGDDVEESNEDNLMPATIDDASSVAETTASSAITAASSRTNMSVHLTVQPKKAKAKVMDSWDDEDLESESSEAASDWDAAEGEGDGEKPAWEEGAGLLNVLKAFKALKEDFDTKFKAMWA